MYKLQYVFKCYLQGAIAEAIRVWVSNYRYQTKRKLTKAGITVLERTTKKTVLPLECEYNPPDNDDLAVQTHLKAR